MAETLASIKLRVSSLIQDTPGFVTTTSGGVMEDAIRDALDQYDADAPLVLVGDLAGTGLVYDWALPATLQYGRSRILTVEYPSGARPMSYLEDDDWLFYQTPTTTAFRLYSVIPGATETVRLTYTSPHTINGLDSATVTTIPVYHTQAFVNLCGSRCLVRLANRFLHEQENTLNLDSVDRSGKSDQARRLANTLMDAYRQIVGVTRGEAAAFATVDWDVNDFGIMRFGGLTHDRRRR